MHNNSAIVKKMESTNLRIENWESHEIEEISYSASLKVPPKEELLRLLPTHLSSLQYPWTCRTGLLSKVEHSLKLCLYREYHEPKIGVYVSIQNVPDSGRIIEVRGVDVTYVSSTSSVEDNMKAQPPPTAMEMPGAYFWQSTIGWPESTCILFLVFNVVKRKPPLIVNDDISQELSASMSTSLTPATCPTYKGFIDAKPFFLNSSCSDVSIQCGQVQFPAHLIILCSRSTYFATMFSSSMKEATERILKIEDMSPASVKELLRFIYLGEIADPTTHARDLFLAADKYDLADLKALCERHLISGLSPENAMEIWDLCQMAGGVTLARKCKQVILWNKGKFGPDPETLKEFTCKYPQLVFELLQFESS